MNYYAEKLEQIFRDPLQKEAYNTEDSTVVIAGPGSGKTTILTLKIMKLLNGYINEPQGLACLTFSREAAREFEDRLKLYGFRGRKNVFLGTVHSFCISEILSKFADVYDYGINMPIKIIPKKLEQQILNDVKKDLGITEKITKVDIDKERALNVNGQSQVLVHSNPTVNSIAREYEKRLLAAGYIDYQGIITLSTQIIQDHEYVRKCISARFPWIVIDEYQDLGKPLHEMVMSLFTTTDIKVFAVGDPDQSIYGFSGAIPDYLMELYNREDTIPVELKNNYRSNQDIVNGSELVLGLERHYKAKTRENEKAEYKFISCNKGLADQFDYFINRILPKCVKESIPLEEIAVLLSYNNDCTELALKCMENNIPYYISRHSFERTDFIKWLEICSKWINNNEEALFSEIYKYWEKLVLDHRNTKYISENDRVLMKSQFLSVLLDSREYKSKISDWITFVIDNLKISELLIDSEIMPDEWENIGNLLKEVEDETYSDYDTSKFSKIGKPSNQITISTRHSSKGLEFEVVVMMGMEEGHFPSWKALKNSDELKETKRICFVCVSRAKRVCVLMHSNIYHEFEKDKHYNPSRYLLALKHKFDTTT